jgi:hypothetical protein
MNTLDERIILMSWAGWSKTAVVMVLVQSTIRRLPNYLSHMEESMAGHVGVKGVY